MNSEMFKSNQMKNRIVHLTSNPCVLQLNDIKIGFINTDVIKDMCLNVCVKTPQVEQEKPAQPKAKIDLVLQSLLQQKTFYPVYPAGLSTAVEWEQFKGLMFD